MVELVVELVVVEMVFKLMEVVEEVKYVKKWNCGGRGGEGNVSKNR